MTTLYDEQPYDCEFAVYASGIVTVCDKQCALCKEKSRYGDNKFSKTVGETFKLTFDKEFTQGDVIPEPAVKKVKVTSEITHKYNRWYHKALYYLTFKQRFVESLEFNVELIDCHKRKTEIMI